MTNGANVYFDAQAPPDELVYVEEDVHGGLTSVARRGDTLTFVTDGIPEAEGGGGDRYGEERMDRRLAAGRTAPPAELIRDLMVDLRGFVDEVAQEDDLTVLAMRIRNIPDRREA